MLIGLRMAVSAGVLDFHPVCHRCFTRQLQAYSKRMKNEALTRHFASFPKIYPVTPTNKTIAMPIFAPLITNSFTAFLLMKAPQ